MRKAWVCVLVVVFGGCLGPRRDKAPLRPRCGAADLEFLFQYAATRRFTLGRPKSIKVVPDGSNVLFLRSGPRSFVQDLYEYDVENGTERVLLTADGILRGETEELSPEELARRERMRMTARGIAGYQLTEDGQHILVPLSGRLFVVERSSGETRELRSDKGFPLDASFSPDGRFVSCVRDGDLYVTEVGTGTETRLTDTASETVTNGLAEFVAQEEMGRFAGHWWSPDGSRIAYQQTDTAGVETFHIMDAMHPEEAPQARPYPRPGKKNAAVRLGIIEAGGSDTVWVDWDAEAYPYLATVRWEEQAPLTILVQNRTQTEEVLLEVDPEAGSTRPLWVERDLAWINLDQDMPAWLPDGSGFFWTTERDGAWQLELHGRDGDLRSPVTDAAFTYKGFVKYDKEANAVYVLGSDGPLETHLYRIRLHPRPQPPVRLTAVPGVHGAVFGESMDVFVHSAETADGESHWIVRDRQGRELGRLASAAETPPFTPRPQFTTTGGEPNLHAVVIRPRDFREGRSYPVIVYVYGGPHAQVVTAAANRYLLQQWIADHGFIVISLDGRGTPARGRAWERVVKGNLIDVPLCDQVAGLTALGAAHPELDMSRVGIYGWSFGGYFSAMAVMRRPEVYTAGVAGAPVCDWLDYDTHYTERYMGLPDRNPDGYEAASVLTYTSNLRRPLLIIHGTADDNVYFMHSLKMSNSLYRAGKAHDFLPLSDFTHMVADPLVTARLYERILQFLCRHLHDHS